MRFSRLSYELCEWRWRTWLNGGEGLNGLVGVPVQEDSTISKARHSQDRFCCTVSSAFKSAQNLVLSEIDDSCQTLTTGARIVEDEPTAARSRPLRSS
jgi:hypothetical protein